MEAVKKGKLIVQHEFISPFRVVIERMGYQIQEPSKNGKDWVDAGTVLQQKNHMLFYLKQWLLADQEGNVDPRQLTLMEKHIETGLDQLFNAPMPLPEAEEIKETGEKILDEGVNEGVNEGVTGEAV